jgi:hypothetical protein
MRKIGDASFFRIVDLLLGAGARGAPAVRGSIEGVDWRRERHRYAGAGLGFTVDVTTGTKTGAAAWTLVVVKEYWRSGTGESIKALQWAHIDSGNRADVVDWLERQERKLESA